MLSESRWRNRKAIEEGFSESEAVEEGFSESKAVEEDFSESEAVEENQILSEENLGSRFDTKISTSRAHGFTWLVFQFFNCS